MAIKQSEIIAGIYTSLKEIPNLYVGYYPTDYEVITNNLPAVLIKPSDSNVVAVGSHIYDIQATVQLILYSDNIILTVLDTQLLILDKIITYLHSQSTQCVTNVQDTIIQTGDINQYITPGSTGYNANIIVRKLTQQYTIKHII